MKPLRLITRTEQHHTTTPPLEVLAVDQEQRVFEHWVFLHREHRPTADRMSSDRRRVIERALHGFGFSVDVLMLAVEGCKASRFCQGENRAGHKLDDVAWILANEARIERLAEIGAKARGEFEAAVAAVDVRPAPLERQTDAQRQRLAQLRKFLASKT